MLLQWRLQDRNKGGMKKALKFKVYSNCTVAKLGRVLESYIGCLSQFIFNFSLWCFIELYCLNVCGTGHCNTVHFPIRWHNPIAWMPDELSPAHKNWSREVRSGLAPLGRNYLLTKICEEIDRPIKLSRRALYDDGQIINSNVIKHVTNTRVEFVFNKHGCRWRAEMYRFESI